MAGLASTCASSLQRVTRRGRALSCGGLSKERGYWPGRQPSASSRSSRNRKNVSHTTSKCCNGDGGRWGHGLVEQSSAITRTTTRWSKCRSVGRGPGCRSSPAAALIPASPARLFGGPCEVDARVLYVWRARNGSVSSATDLTGKRPRVLTDDNVLDTCTLGLPHGRIVPRIATGNKGGALWISACLIAPVPYTEPCFQPPSAALQRSHRHCFPNMMPIVHRASLLCRTVNGSSAYWRPNPAYGNEKAIVVVHHAQNSQRTSIIPHRAHPPETPYATCVYGWSYLHAVIARCENPKESSCFAVACYTPLLLDAGGECPDLPHQVRTTRQGPLPHRGADTAAVAIIAACTMSITGFGCIMAIASSEKFSIADLVAVQTTRKTAGKQKADEEGRLRLPTLVVAVIVTATQGRDLGARLDHWAKDCLEPKKRAHPAAASSTPLGEVLTKNAPQRLFVDAQANCSGRPWPIDQVHLCHRIAHCCTELRYGPGTRRGAIVGLLARSVVLRTHRSTMPRAARISVVRYCGHFAQAQHNAVRRSSVCSTTLPAPARQQQLVVRNALDRPVDETIRTLSADELNRELGRKSQGFVIILAAVKIDDRETATPVQIPNRLAEHTDVFDKKEATTVPDGLEHYHTIEL
nr:hypothetical protein CFP56_04489 [Quercus suber]